MNPIEMFLAVCGCIIAATFTVFLVFVFVCLAKDAVEDLWR